MKTIMILGASILQVPAIKKAIDMGLKVIVVDMNPEAIGFKIPGVIKKVISTTDIKGVVRSAKRNKIDGIITIASDMPMLTVAAVCKELNLIGIDEQTALRATNKAIMRNSLKKNSVPIPLYFVAKSYEDYIISINKIKDKGYKAIIKPVDNSGSRGIFLLDEYNGNKIDEAYYYSKSFSKSGEVMVEEYIEGPEVSVETISIDGTCNIIQITDKLTTGSPYFVEMGHSQPSKLPEKIQEKIREITISANKAIGIFQGPSHTEIRVSKDGPKIIEIGARLGGDNITTHLTPLSTGIDMVKAVIDISLGNKVDIKRKQNFGSAIRYFNVGSGNIKSIKNVDKAKNIPGIVQVSILIEENYTQNGIRSSVDRVGFVIAKGKSSSEAVNIAEKAVSLVKFEMD